MLKCGCKIKIKWFDFWLLVLDQTQEVSFPGSHFEICMLGWWWTTCPGHAGLPQRAQCQGCAADWALPFLHWLPSLSPHPVRGKHPARHCVFWAARVWVARGFPPAAPCSGRLNAAPMVISWLKIPDLPDKNITRDRGAKQMLAFL